MRVGGRQNTKKERAPGTLQIQSKSTTTSFSFADLSRPLAIDIGSGFGTSLLGLAYHSLQKTNQVFSSFESLNANCANCNFLGCDLSEHAVGYAKGLAARWGLSDRLMFVHMSGEELLRNVVTSYPGPILLVMLQFPTPYKLAALDTSAGVEDSSIVSQHRAEAIDQRIRKRKTHKTEVVIDQLIPTQIITTHTLTCVFF